MQCGIKWSRARTLVRVIMEEKPVTLPVGKLSDFSSITLLQIGMQIENQKPPNCEVCFNSNERRMEQV